MKGNSSRNLLRQSRYQEATLFRTGRLRAQDVGERDVLESIRFSDLIVVLSKCHWCRNLPRDVYAKRSQGSVRRRSIIGVPQMVRYTYIDASRNSLGMIILS